MTVAPQISQRLGSGLPSNGLTHVARSEGSNSWPSTRTIVAEIGVVLLSLSFEVDVLGEGLEDDPWAVPLLKSDSSSASDISVCAGDSLYCCGFFLRGERLNLDSFPSSESFCGLGGVSGPFRPLRVDISEVCVQSDEKFGLKYRELVLNTTFKISNF